MRKHKTHRRIWLRVLPVLCFLFLSRAAIAVDPHARISLYSHSAWQTPEALGSRPIAVTQTTDGYIWISTYDGLFRFDGVKFTAWRPPGNQRLPSRGIQYLLGSRDGSLWLGTQGGLSRYRDGRLTNYVKDKREAGISGILEDHAGKIWVTRYRILDKTGPLCRAEQTMLRCYGKSEGMPARYALGISEDSAGNIWMGCQALCRWEQGTSTTYLNEQFDHPSGEGVQDVATIAGEVWASLDGTGPKLGLQHFANGKWGKYVIPGLDGSKLSGPILFVDRHQTLWIGTSDGIYHVHDGFADHYGLADGLTSNDIHCFYEDREGNLWVGTDHGLDMFRDYKVLSFSKNQGTSSSNIHSLLTIAGDSVWAGGSGGLDIINEGPYAAIRHQAIPGHSVRSMLQDSHGQVWLGIDHKIFSYQEGRYIEVRNANGSPLNETNAPTAIAEDSDGDIWALITSSINGTNDYLLDIRDHRVRQKVRVRNSDTDFLAGDRRSGFWALAADGELMHYVNSHIIYSARLVDEAKSSFETYALHMDSQGVLWAPSSRGLYRWSAGLVTVLGEKNGLPCRSVQSMIEDDRGTHWLRTACGILQIPAGEWAKWLKSPDSKITFSLFGPLDGTQQGGSDGQPSIAKTRNGRIWFAAGSFVQMVDPSQMPASGPPPVHIEELVADHKAYEDLARLRLPPLKGELQIDYTALTFKLPHKAQFRYKLEGHDREWQEVGTRRQAFYSDLPPRHYRFRVIASNSDGVWNETGATLDFSILPAYYQTIWFRMICGAAVLLALWLLYQFRVRQLRRQFHAAMEVRVNERTRIARELHDTLLQSFQGLLLCFQSASNLLPERPEEAKRRVDSAIEQAAVAVTEGRDAVHELRSGGLGTVDLAESIGNFARELLGHPAAGGFPEFQIQVEGTPRALNPVVRDEVYRIAAEALRNAIRHSEARRFEVEIRYDQETMRLHVRDDGKGIDTDVLAKEHMPGHWGLCGMRERAKLMGARFEIWSKPGSGTEIQLEIPAATAYGKPSPSRISFFARLFEIKNE